jgi:hypothetical protein
VIYNVVNIYLACRDVKIKVKKKRNRVGAPFAAALGIEWAVEATRIYADGRGFLKTEQKDEREVPPGQAGLSWAACC